MSEEQPVADMNSVLYVKDLPPPPPPPPPISIEELLTSVEALLKKETDDKALIESIQNITLTELKTKLLAWAAAGFPNGYEIFKFDVSPPNTCSDGAKRNMLEYVQYCSGKQLHEHISTLSQKTTGMNIGYTNYETYFSIVVSKF